RPAEVRAHRREATARAVDLDLAKRRREGAVEQRLASRHHGLVLIPEERVHRDQARADSLRARRLESGNEELDVDARAPWVERYEAREHVRPGARAVDRAAVIEPRVAVDRDVEDERLATARGAERRLGAIPRRGVPEEAHVAERFRMEPWQMLPIQDVFPDPLERCMDDALVDGGRHLRHPVPAHGRRGAWRQPYGVR